MLDRALTAADTPGDGVPPCRCCTQGRETAPAGNEADAAWLAQLYLCRRLSTDAIGELTGLARQRVTRMLRKTRMPLRPRGAGRLRPLRRYGIAVRTRGDWNREDRRTGSCTLAPGCGPPAPGPGRTGKRTGRPCLRAGQSAVRPRGSQAAAAQAGGA